MTFKRSQAITVIYWVLVAAWAILIFMMSAHTGSDLEHGNGPFSQVKRFLHQALSPFFGQNTDAESVIGHFCEYAVFGGLLFMAVLQLRGHCRMFAAHENRELAEREESGDTDSFGSPSSLDRLWIVLLVATAIASIYGVTDELHQIFVPGRACDPKDWLTDTCGAALGACVCALVVFARASKSEKA